MTSFKLPLTIVTFVIGIVLLLLTSFPESTATLVSCDVGQGDAAIIKKGTTQILVDGGPTSDKILSCLSRHLPFWDRTIELVVFTNTDYDHLNGLSAVIARYKVGKIITGDGIGESDAVSQFVSTLRLTNQQVEQVGAGDIINVGQKDNLLTLHVLWPENPNPSVLLALDPLKSEEDKNRVLGESVVKNTNERSVVIFLEENGVKALLTGDIGEVVEKSLLKANVLEDINILKVAHHGSKYSSSQAFLEKVKPELGVISVGAKNRYGHPTDETLARLQNVGANIRRTDKEGDIVINLVSP